MTRDLPKEIVKAVETGVNRFLNKSLIYSPFRIFYNLFKKSNPKSMDSVRQRVRDDIEGNLHTIDNYNPDLFIEGTSITPLGRKLLQSCYEIGIILLKKKLTVVTAFKAMRNAQLLEEIYNDLLTDIINATKALIPEQIPDQEASQTIEETEAES